MPASYERTVDLFLVIVIISLVQFLQPATSAPILVEHEDGRYALYDDPQYAFGSYDLTPLGLNNPLPLTNPDFMHVFKPSGGKRDQKMTFDSTLRRLSSRLRGMPVSEPLPEQKEKFSPETIQSLMAGLRRKFTSRG